MNEKQKRIYHNTLRKESQKRNTEKVKEQNRKYREQKKQCIVELQHQLALTEKALGLACWTIERIIETKTDCKGVCPLYDCGVADMRCCYEKLAEYFKQQAEKEMSDGI